MKKIVFIVSSLFNLILAFHMRTTLLADSACDIVLTDGSNGLKEIYENGTLRRYFTDVFFSSQCQISKLSLLESAFNPGKAYQKLLGIHNMPEYSDVFFWNPDHTFYFLYMENNRIKQPLRLHVYSDALTGWFLDAPDDDIPGGVKLYRRILFLNSFVKKYGFMPVYQMDFDYYMFYPENSMIPHKHKVHAIPSIKRDNKCEIAQLNEIFGFDAEYTINQKYIFIDGPSTRWTDREAHRDYLRELCNLVGENNFLVKPHPRTKAEEYDGYGVNVEKQVYPWDLYCLNHGLNDKVLITYDGAGAFTPSLLYDMHPTLILAREALDPGKEGFPKEVWNHFCSLVDNGTNRVLYADRNNLQKTIEQIEAGG